MALVTLICSIISASVASINMFISINNSIVDISVVHTYENDGKRAFLRINVENNSDTSVKITNLVVKTDNGIVKTSSGTPLFTPFDGPYVLLSHDTTRYGYQLSINEKPKMLSITFSKRVSLMSHRKVIFLD